LPETEFTALQKHILAGYPPKRVLIEIEFESEAFSFGWEPDGSGIKWKNLADRNVRIYEVRFDFSYSESPSEDEPLDDFFSEPVGRKDFADTARVARALTSRLIAIERLAKWALVFGVICAALLVKFAIH
jgi:hypothetical protein